MLVAIATLQSSALDSWPAVAIGGLLIVGSLEFVGPFDQDGWKLAGAIVPFAYIAWSFWLIVTGVVLLATGSPRPALRRPRWA